MNPTPEQSYMQTTSIHYRRQKGQYFTPPPIAELMVEWLMPSRPSKLLDPAVGLGIFPRMMKKKYTDESIHWSTYDIDPTFIPTLQSSGFQMNLEDFLQSDWDEQFDGILANPPYFKLRNYTSKEAILRTFEKKLGFTLPGSTNMYNLFILKCLEQLQEGGRAAFIVPSDFLNADYGWRIKNYLIQQNLLDYVVITDYQVSWFEDAMTTSAILLCSRTHHKSGFEFINIQSDEELNDFHAFLTKHDPYIYGKYYTYQEIDPKIKWRHFYQESVLTSYRNLRPFHHFGKATRGIATGANEFFCLSEEERRSRGLGEDITQPCLTKAYQASRSIFTWQDWISLKEENHPVYLLQVYESQIKDEAVKQYIDYGAAQGFDQRYLTKHRTPWYKPELRKPAPILFRVFNRSNLHFIRNEAGILHLTCFHGLYIHEKYQQDMDIIMAYFLTNVAKKIIRESRREYGKGLLKFEPNDLNQSYVVDFDSITYQEKRRIQALYMEYRNQENTDTSLYKLNELFEGILSR